MVVSDSTLMVSKQNYSDSKHYIVSKSTAKENLLTICTQYENMGNIDPKVRFYEEFWCIILGRYDNFDDRVEKEQKKNPFGVLNVADIRDTTMINKSVGYQGKINSKKYLARM